MNSNKNISVPVSRDGVVSPPSACDQCPGCQALIKAGSRFCPNYGQQLVPSSPPPPITCDPKAKEPVVETPAPLTAVAESITPLPATSSPVVAGTTSSSSTETQPLTSCGACGRAADEDDYFCPRCGNKVKDPPVKSQYWLVCQKPQEPSVSLLLSSGEFVIGKAPDCTLAIPDDEYLSRRHLKLNLQDGKITVEDLGSSNGSFLKIRRPITLEPDDVILAGSNVLKVELRTS